MLGVCTKGNSVIQYKRKDNAFRHQFDEKPSFTLGCPGNGVTVMSIALLKQHLAGRSPLKVKAAMMQHTFVISTNGLNGLE